jgi:hypothetical protein
MPLASHGGGSSTNQRKFNAEAGTIAIFWIDKQLSSVNIYAPFRNG